MTRPLGAIRWLWVELFGPPRIKRTPDGYLRVRLLGRLHEASSYESLLDSVSRERDRIILSASRMREGSPLRHFSSGRYGPGELHHRDMQRLEDRLSVYNDFIGHLMAQMQMKG